MDLRGLSAAALAALLFVAGCQSKPNEPADTARTVEEPAGPPLFEDITAGSALSFTYRNGEETADHFAILEAVGGGVALIDYDGDGLLDVFLTGGGTYAGDDLKDIVGLPCRLYRNLGGGKFKDVTAEVGLDRLAGGSPWFYNHGTAVADYDRDGWPDLLVTGWGRLALFHNIPVDPKNPARGRRFEDVTAQTGLGQGITWATSAAFGDLDGDGYPDLYVCQYVNWSFANHPKCDYNGRKADVCPPRNFDGLPHKVYRNTGTGKFTDVSDKAGLVPAGRDSSKGLGVLLIDVDGDGKPDVYVANDAVDKFLYLNRSVPGTIRFEEIGQTSGAARDGLGHANGSMGVDAGDYDGSGRPALWVTNYENEQHGLYRNSMRPGTPFFNYRSIEAGLGAGGQKYVGWGTAFIDVDLDGWEDLLVVNGHAVRYFSETGAPRLQPPMLYRNLGGKFKDVSRQIGSYHETNHLARGVGFGDLDNDGRTDLVISHINDPVTVLRGIGGRACHWLGVQLIGKDHADVVGARAELQVGERALTRFAKGGGSYLSSGDRRLLFGMGPEAKPGRLTVTWPDGLRQTFDGLAGDRYHRIHQGRAQPEAYTTRE
jgi:enediyne biosynthesis protein E4